MSKPEEEAKEGAKWVSGGQAFHAEGTANVKVLRQDVLQLQGTGTRQRLERSEAERVIGVEIKRKYFAKGNQSISLVIRKRQNKITVKYHFTSSRMTIIITLKRQNKSVGKNVENFVHRWWKCKMWKTVF